MPDEDVGAVADAGSVNVLYGSAAGVTSAGNQLWTQNSGGDPRHRRDGRSLRRGAGDRRATRQRRDGDLAVGVPDEDVGAVADAGSVQVLYGSAVGLAAAGNQLWTQNSGGILDSVEAGDRFGAALAAIELR